MNLSGDDDKKWFETQLGRLSAANEVYVDSRLNNLSATLEAYIDARHQEQRAALEAVETILLMEFHKWASPPTPHQALPG